MISERVEQESICDEWDSCSAGAFDLVRPDDPRRHAGRGLCERRGGFAVRRQQQWALAMSYSVAGDWGTRNLRLYRIENGAVVDRAVAPGIGDLGDRTPEQVLRCALEGWCAVADPRAIHMCGMVGSRNGWIKIPYVDCPADAAIWAAGSAHALIDRIPVMMGAGRACTHVRGAPDVLLPPKGLTGPRRFAR